MDDIDFATERAETFNATALQMVLRRPSAARSSGTCMSCHEDIEAERLEANPHARHCCDCAAEEEAVSRRTRRCGPR
jgi:RNA polymerase-binding transcription factor DksA